MPFNDTAYAFKRRIQARGYKFIGSGSYSSVYHRPGEANVIKINARPDPWPAYIEWARDFGFLGGLAPAVGCMRKKSWGYVATMEYLPQSGTEVGGEVFHASLALSQLFYWGGMVHNTDLLDKYCPNWSQFQTQYKLRDLGPSDICSANIRYRPSTKTLVITDPVYEMRGKATQDNLKRREKFSCPSQPAVIRPQLHPMLPWSTAKPEATMRGNVKAL